MNINQKGFMGIVSITLFAVLMVIVGYFAITKNKDAEDFKEIAKQVLRENLLKRDIPQECLEFSETKDSQFITYNIKRKFNSKCSGDPTSTPTIPAIKIDLATKAVFVQSLDGEFNPLVAWNTYKNNTYGYEVRYPDNWRAGGGVDTKVFFMEKNGQDWSLIISVVDKPIDEAEAALPLLSVPGRQIDSRTNVTINGINWVELVVEENQIARLTYHNGQTYVATYSTLNGSMSTQVVSTFKFIK